MNLYEIAYLVTADISETEAKDIDNRLASFIQEEGGFIINQNALIRKKLAYPVKKQTQAYLTSIVFRLPAEKIASLEKQTKSNNSILRHLLIAKKELKIFPEKKRRTPVFQKTEISSPTTDTTKEKKVELKDIDKKLEEILEQS